VLTLSRGASLAILVGLAVCVVMRGGRATLLAAGCALAGIVGLGAALSAFPDVLSLTGGDRDAQVSQGAVLTPIALLVAAAAGLAFARLVRTRAGAIDLRLARRARAALAVATVLVALAVAVAVSASQTERTDVPRSAARIVRLDTDRGHYWRVALEAFRRHPLVGIGSGSFAVEWNRERGDDQPALDAHSLYVETLAELGIVGVALLLGFLVTLAAGTLRAARASPRDTSVVAAASVLAAFLVHAGIDWDWEMPAVVLVPLILCAAALCAQGARERYYPTRRRRGGRWARAGRTRR
jgi:O-antigen ligase